MAQIGDDEQRVQRRQMRSSPSAPPEPDREREQGGAHDEVEETHEQDVAVRHQDAQQRRSVCGRAKRFLEIENGGGNRDHANGKNELLRDERRHDARQQRFDDVGGPVRKQPEVHHQDRPDHFAAGIEVTRQDERVVQMARSVLRRKIREKPDGDQRGGGGGCAETFNRAAEHQIWPLAGG